jgi:murein DD-endopeptidase MepM/ murein hydrolase activator NlpD
MEMFNMAITNGSGDLESLSQAQLTEHYNQLAAAAERPLVKSFKDKATAIKRIGALQDDASEPNEAQKRAAAERDAKEAHANDNAFNKHLAAKRAAKSVAEKPVAEKPVVADAPKAAAKGKSAAAKKATAKKAEAKQPAAKKAAKSEGEKKPRGQGIGAYACEAILKGKSNEEVVAIVLKKFPDASTSASSVAWYRNKLKNEGKLT